MYAINCRKRLLADVEAGRLDTIVVYKVDRLTRSLADFALIVERLEAPGVAFVSVDFPGFNGHLSKPDSTWLQRPPD